MPRSTTTRRTARGAWSYACSICDAHHGACAAARRLRAAGATAPVVAVTAAALPREEFEDDTERASLQDLDDDDDAIALAFDDVISSKPFGFGDALSAVERWVLPRLHRKRRGDSPGRLPRVEVEGGPASRAAPAKRRRRLAPVPLYGATARARLNSAEFVTRRIRAAPARRRPACRLSRPCAHADPKPGATAASGGASICDDVP